MGSINDKNGMDLTDAEDIKKRWQEYTDCYCQVTSVMSNSVRPHKRQPTRLPCPWVSPSNNTGVDCHFLLQCMKVKSKSEVAQLCPTLSNPHGLHAAYQAPPSMEFSRQKYWSGVPLLSPRIHRRTVQKRASRPR